MVKDGSNADMSALEWMNPRVTPLITQSSKAKSRGWRPGDLCRAWIGPDMGIVCAIIDDEHVLVLWGGRSPDITHNFMEVSVMHDAGFISNETAMTMAGYR
jgi:hypothetical protein